MNVEKDRVVAVHYVLKDDQGEVLDSSEGLEPLMYIHGHGKIIVGLEEALAGKAVGDHVDVVIPPEKAYGEYYDTMVQVVQRDQFEGDFDLQPGIQFEGETEVGPHLFTVVEIEGDDVTVDGNHPLAGAELHFSLDVHEIREPTPEELKDGYPAGHEDDGAP